MSQDFCMDCGVLLPLDGVCAVCGFNNGFDDAIEDLSLPDEFIPYAMSDELESVFTDESAGF